jgi:cysteine synthase
MFDELFGIVDAKVRAIGNNGRTKDIHSLLIARPRVREILEIETPVIHDVSEILEVSKGKVLAVRMDKTFGITGFKKPVIASLILKRLIEAVRRKEYNKTWIDGGNVNSSLGLAYYAKKFDGNAAFVMSRFFPEYVLDYIREVSNKSIHLIKAPNLGLGIERDFYQYLVDLVRTDEGYKTYQPLWHAKYGGEYTQVLGDELANELNFCPDYIVTVVGAGSTIEGQAIPVKVRFNNSPKIVVPEHSQSHLLHLNKLAASFLNKAAAGKEYPRDWFISPPPGLPHTVIGPHYDEINPLIKKEVLKSIESVFLYEEDDWKRMSYGCYEKGMEIGNSSAANLVIAKRLAGQGNTVLTFIYEPFRSIYQGHNVGEHDSTGESKFHPMESRPAHFHTQFASSQINAQTKAAK